MGKRKSAAADTTPSASPNKKVAASPAQQVGAGFYAVLISVPSTSIRPAPTHYIYCRAHASKSEDAEKNKLPSGRTLFAVNLPVDTTETHLRSLFKKAGTIERISFHQLRDVQGANEEAEQGDDQEESAEEEASKEGKGKGKAADGPPSVIRLPPLEPRRVKGSEPLFTTASSAHIIFLDKSSLDRAIEQIKAGQASKAWPDPFKRLAEAAEKAQLEADAAPGKKRSIPNADAAAVAGGASVPPIGLAYLLEAYKSARPSNEAVKRYADSAIARFAYMKAHPRKIGVKGVTVGPDGELLDEDGFTIVQRGGKYGRSASVGVSTTRLGQETEKTLESANKKSEDLEDFYRFQMREKKREKLADLRAKFEADREKVAKLKASRRFKPY